MKIQISPKAANDINQIKKYICEEYDNPTAANRIVKRIMDSYERLEEFPYIRKRLDGFSDVITDYRFLNCDKYLIFYTVEEEIVLIDRVIHSKRDYCKLLFNDEN
ncbi:MAG: type II toxin-antitoxin system RelE/ParE family toxin [Oscillospiraceae bacterium]|nr:type II toxin-antitoxin system RelE/ParE family toxin [Oscillospiraceae bacterium]